MKIIGISAIWCSSCLIMKKVWTKAKQKYPNLEWVEYDLDFDPEATSYQVEDKLPVLILEQNGLEQSRVVGEKTIEEVFVWLSQNIKENY